MLAGDKRPADGEFVTTSSKNQWRTQIFFFWGGFNKFSSGQGRENGDLGAVVP
jgi:hypothetical protein